MCWVKIFKPDELPKIKKKKGPKEVYKILDGTTSPYMNFTYELGRLNTEITLTPITVISKQPSTNISVYMTLIHEGYHSYSNIAHAIYMSKKHVIGDIKVCRCIIPRNAYYYENDNGEVVSSNIIIKELCVGSETARTN